MTVIQQKMRAVKEASRTLTLNAEKRNAVLETLSQTLLNEVDSILQANQQDLAQMSISDPKYDRLLLNQERINYIAKEVRKVATLADPLAQVLLEKTLPNGLKLKKITVPIGIVGVIYESRPNVTIDVFALCFKAGNGCILKGGKEALATNVALLNVITKTLSMHQISTDIVYLLPPEREATRELLNAVGIVDVCIPRGSQELINYVRENAKIPVIETGAGIVHTYFDESGSLEKGKAIIHNAKTRRVSVCNALDTLIIHEKRLQDLPQLIAQLKDHQVEIFADEKSYQTLVGTYPKEWLHLAVPGDFGKEFLSYKMSIKTTPTYQDAVAHIMHYTSGHSEAIIAEDKRAIDYFLQQVDAAAVYVNTSTAFTDGGEFGMGAEIGISTQKLHARGPMGLEALTSYKWLIFGDGQIRA